MGMRIIGHRGASGYAPENTAQSFELAIQMGANMIECDVQASKSGDIFILHDDTLERTTNGTGLARCLTMNALRSFDAGGGQSILTLEEALDVIDRRVPINIEVKAPRVAQRITRIIQHYVRHKGWRYEDFLVSSFQYKQLRHFVSLDSCIPLAAILEKQVPRYFWKYAEMLGCKAICLDKTLAMQTDTVKRAHERGMAVYVWTVNTEAEVGLLQSVGIDGIFTDYPDRFVALQ
jgi:glycerophosphoryl diester phosphodiesterase